MARLTSGADDAGMANTAARVALLLMWAATGVAAPAIAGRLDLEGVLGVVAYGLPAVGVLVLTSRRTPLGRRALAAVLVATVLPVVLVAIGTGKADEYGLVNFCVYVLALLMPRGHPLAGGLGGVALVAGVLTWGFVSGQSARGVFEMLLMPATALVGSALWWLLLIVVVRRERRAVGVAEAAQVELDAAAVADREYRVRMAGLADRVRPLLAEIAEGAPLDAARHRRIGVVEGDVRDELRAPELRHQELAAEIAQARHRGVRVLLLGDGTGQPLDQETAGTLVALLRDPTLRAVTIRALPEGRRAAVTAVVERDGGTERIELARDGTARAR